jgi:hypothetical protein
LSNGFEQAKAQRNALERLTDRIPGFRGFQDRELRREVDKLQREHLAGEVGRVKTRLRDLARDYTDAGRIGVLDRFERLDRRLDGLSQSIRHADYGNSGFFAPQKVGEEELARLYEFDLSLLDDLAALDRQVTLVPPPGGGEPEAALDGLLEQLRGVETKWGGREQVISNVVQDVR